MLAYRGSVIDCAGYQSQTLKRVGVYSDETELRRVAHKIFVQVAALWDCPYPMQVSDFHAAAALTGAAA